MTRFARTTGTVLALSTLALTVPQAQTVREACAADVAKFCSDAPDLQSRRQCMSAHRAELSPACRAAARQAANHPAQGVQDGAQPSTPDASPTTAGPPASVEPGSAGGDQESVARRVADRSFPSVFAPWNFGPNRQPPTGLAGDQNARMAAIARHDLFWNVWNSLGLRSADGQPYIILSPQFAPDSIQTALRNRAALLAANPNLVVLANVNYFGASANSQWLPPDSTYWRGQQKSNEYNNRRLDFTNPAFQDKVATLCAALVKTGVFDGCMLDLWNDQWDNKQDHAREAAARLPLIQKIRAAVGDKAILVGNVNGQLPISTAAYLDGIYMEGFGSWYFPDWHTAAVNLLWAQSHLRKPAITALEGWYPCPTQDCHQGDPTQIQQQGRADLARMRFVTTLSLVFSNGYVLFSDPDELPTPDHLHDWYPFWDKSLGKPVGPLATLDHPNLAGAYTRDYELGEVVFNPPSNRPVTINLPDWRRSAATNAVGRTFTVAPGDGDLFLKERMPQK